jgi:hypothetical protein
MTQTVDMDGRDKPGHDEFGLVEGEQSHLGGPQSRAVTPDFSL